MYQISIFLMASIRSDSGISDTIATLIEKVERTHGDRVHITYNRINREPMSTLFGCFDRPYAKDVSQYTLLFFWKNPGPEVIRGLDAAFEYLGKQTQSRNLNCEFYLEPEVLENWQAHIKNTLPNSAIFQYDSQDLTHELENRLSQLIETSSATAIRRSTGDETRVANREDYTQPAAPPPSYDDHNQQTQAHMPLMAAYELAELRAADEERRQRLHANEAHRATPPVPRPPALARASTFPQPLDDYIEAVRFRYVPQPEPQEMEDPDWWFAENDKGAIEGVHIGRQEWILAGASRRGYSHQNNGTPRDDAFKLGASDRWNIIAVSDGAGSAKYSRVTANRSVKMAVDLLKAQARNAPQDPKAAVPYMTRAIQDTMRQIHRDQKHFTEANKFTKQDTYCTFILLVHQPIDEQTCVFGHVHIGDGFTWAATTDKAGRSFSTGDHGEVANESTFVLSYTEDEVAARAQAFKAENIDFFMIVSDGIEDDLKPSTQQYERGIMVDDQFRDFTEMVRGKYLIWPYWDEWDLMLDRMINYERAGSFDDRTIAILTPKTGI